MHTISRAVFTVKQGDLVRLVKGGEEIVFVKSEEDEASRKQRRYRPALSDM